MRDKPYPYKPGCYIYNKHFYWKEPHWTGKLWKGILGLPRALWKMYTTPVEWDFPMWVACSCLIYGFTYYLLQIWLLPWHAWQCSKPLMCLSPMVFMLITIRARKIEELKNKQKEESDGSNEPDGSIEPCATT